MAGNYDGFTLLLSNYIFCVAVGHLLLCRQTDFKKKTKVKAKTRLIHSQAAPSVKEGLNNTVPLFCHYVLKCKFLMDETHIEREQKCQFFVVRCN